MTQLLLLLLIILILLYVIITTTIIIIIVANIIITVSIICYLYWLGPSSTHPRAHTRWCARPSCASLFAINTFRRMPKWNGPASGIQAMDWNAIERD